MPPRVAGLLQHLGQQRRQPFHLARLGRSRNCLPRHARPSARTSSYRHTATAWPRFIDGCRRSSCCCIGIVSSQWQWLNSSLLRPVFSEPKSSATRPLSRQRLAYLGRSLGQRMERMLQRPLAHRRRPHNQRAVGDCFGDAAKLCRTAPAPPTRRPQTAPSQTAQHTRSRRADGESQSRASPAPPRRYCSDCARAPAPHTPDRVVAGSARSHHSRGIAGKSVKRADKTADA